MARRALEYALDAYADAEITVLHVVGGTTPMMGGISGLALEDDVEEAAEKRSEAVFGIAEEVASEHGATIDTETRIGHPARTIIEASEGFDTVVIGSHSGSLVDRLFVGNVAESVFRQAPIPVVVVR